MNEFRRTGLGKLVNGRLNVRCANYGYQYSDIMLALFCVYLCGGVHIEDTTTVLNKYLGTAPNAKIPSSDTLSRGLKELRTLSIAYTNKTGGCAWKPHRPQHHAHGPPGEELGQGAR